MAITTMVTRYDSITRQLEAAGDLSFVIYDLTIDEADNNAYPQGGEPIDFSGEFQEVHHVSCALGYTPNPAGTLGDRAVGIDFERAAGAPGVNTGALRFFVGAVTAAGAPELAEAQYDGTTGSFAFSLMVAGRPISDNS